MQSILATANVLTLLLSTAMQLVLVMEIRTLKLSTGSAASSYIMRRFKKQDPRNEPFMAFCSGLFSKSDDLVGIGASVAGGLFRGNLSGSARPSVLSISESASVGKGSQRTARKVLMM